MKSEIEHRSNLTYSEFLTKYLYLHKPVVITDALRDRRALTRWTPEFFKQEFGDMQISFENGKVGTLQYTMSDFIDHVLSSDDQNPAPYFRNRVLRETFPTLVADVEPLPPYFSPNWMSEKFLFKPVRDSLNRGGQMEIYIGGKGAAFPYLHYDGMGSHAFLLQVYGQKRFILYDPDQEQYLYPSKERPNHTQIASIDHPDLEKYPLFARATPITFILAPGEMLFIPYRWWHTTKMLTPSISLSVNVANESNWQELVDFVCVRRSAPARIPARAYLNCAGAWRMARERRNPDPALPAARKHSASVARNRGAVRRFFAGCLLWLCYGIQSVVPTI